MAITPIIDEINPVRRMHRLYIEKSAAPVSSCSIVVSLAFSPRLNDRKKVRRPNTPITTNDGKNSTTIRAGKLTKREILAPAVIIAATRIPRPSKRKITYVFFM
jgi:hypothetical protein